LNNEKKIVTFTIKFSLFFLVKNQRVQSHSHHVTVFLSTTQSPEGGGEQEEEKSSTTSSTAAAASTAETGCQSFSQCDQSI
jgi:hypothetical protein